jgi:hypothetical protein
MTLEKVRSLVVAYRELLDRRNPEILPAQMGDEDDLELACLLSVSTRVAHYKFMCGKIVALMEEGTTDKAMRWLGFLQGVLWREHGLTLKELKDQSKS